MRQFVALQGRRFKVASRRAARTGLVCEGHVQEVAVETATLLTDAEPVIKDWLISRNCSVSPRQFVGFYVSLALCSTMIALLLAVCGAWLVAPFTGVELLAVGIACVIHARHAVDYERICLFPNRLVIEQVCAERLTQFEFNPRWVRVEPDVSPRAPIKVVSRGQTVVIGQHLAHYRRAQFASELRGSLQRCG
jgi:uncharacterized membrane protein